MLHVILNWHSMHYNDKMNYLRSLNKNERKQLMHIINVLKEDRTWYLIMEVHKQIINNRDIMVMDTETTGLAPGSRIVQLSFAIFDCDGTQKELYDYIIRQEEGIIIPQVTVDIHGITDEIAKTQGHKLKKVIKIFKNRLKFVRTIVGHNISFDMNMLSCELDRINKPECKHQLEQRNTYCTMKSTIDIVGLKTAAGRKKNPKLSELYKYLFNKEIANAHNAKYDVLNTAKCYFELRRREKEFNSMINIIDNF
jgi:DNA polymerase III alpha subunit (gram-positive type)